MEVVQLVSFNSETFYSRNIADKLAYKKCIGQKKFQMGKIER